MSIGYRAITLHSIILSWSCLRCFTDSASDTLFQGQQLTDSQSLTSANQAFSLRFFSPPGDNSTSRYYLGIFYHTEAAPVWIANRNAPIEDSSGILTINSTDGMLNIISTGQTIVFATTWFEGHGNMNTSATLRDDGNLVLRKLNQNGNASGRVLWQSFDYPTDVFLPGMKLGFNLETGHQWSLTSWISDHAPSSGSFTLGLDRDVTSGQLVIRWHEDVYWTSKMWHRDSFGNFRSDHKGLIFNFTYISMDNEKYFKYADSHTDTAIRLNSDGNIVTLVKGEAFVSCDLFSSKDFQPGCVDNSLPACGNGDSFYSQSGSYVYSSMPFSIKEDYGNLSIIDCEAKCVQNCSCYGYASLHMNGTGCEFWDRDSVEIIAAFEGRERLIYFRGRAASPGAKKWRMWLITSICGTLLLLLSITCIGKNYWMKENSILPESVDTSGPNREQIIMAREKIDEEKMSQLHLFRYETIQMATNNFSIENKLGEGGFGTVFKGKLLHGQEIAVKKLSRNSRQGPVEFENEVELVVKLQHKNLVRLFGCCVQRREMMLVYEYMPNKSLDHFLFDPTKKESLKWEKRMSIIEGIAQGLLYLHKHSRLRVVHRDLKASNILLDWDMTPKISDFGIARMFGMEDFEVCTKRIMGTRGYMSPEYVIKGIISTKIDVFSFGVLVLEIVSGKKNRCSENLELNLNLIKLAWEMWDDGRALELVDATVNVSGYSDEVERCISVGLLCVQDSAADRPSMKDVIFMLKNHDPIQLPSPKRPAFFDQTSTTAQQLRAIQKSCSNEISVEIIIDEAN